MSTKHFLFLLIFIAVGLTTQSQDLSVGLVAYYSFCDCTTTDHSGNGNDATLVGNPVCLDGIKRQGFRLNANPGTNDCGTTGGEYIQMPTFDAIWENGFTVCAWVQYENLSNYERIIDMGNGSGDDGGMAIWFGREGIPII